MPRTGPRKVQRYSLEFKLTAVKLSQLPGIEVQAVADALEIHPFMLSFWETEAFLKQRHADLDYTDEDLARDRGDTIDRHREGGSSDAIKMQAPSVSASGHLRVAEQTYRPPPRPKNNSSPWSTLASSVGDTCPKILRMRRLSIERR